MNKTQTEEVEEVEEDVEEALKKIVQERDEAYIKLMEKFDNRLKCIEGFCDVMKDSEEYKKAKTRREIEDILK